MFRRLAQLEAFDSGSSQQQSQYNQNQAYLYNTYLPNVIPTQSSYAAPQALRSALQNVNPVTGAAVDVVPEPERLFRPAGPASSLQQLQQACLAGSIDGLVSSQDPARQIRCGWMYTPPIPGSPIPQVSQGFLGTDKGPLQSLGNTTAYQTWYWDLNQAQKQIRIDTCKSLKNCGDVGADPYSGACGYCTDIGQGIPIDGNGNPLYNDSPLTRCSSQNIVLQGTSCPAPPPPPPGPSPPPSTCTPNAAGQLSASCLEQVLGQAGCTDQGALSLALSSGATPSDYMATARTLPSMVLYNQRAPTAFNVAMYSQGQATVAQALAEARQLSMNASSQPSTSALGASARDLCLQKGAINNYDFCADLVDSTPINGVDPSCLQKVFLQGGGTPDGTMYPSATNPTALSFFNTLGTWGAFKTYVANLYGMARGPSTQEGFRTQQKGSRYGAQRRVEGFTAYDTARQAYQQQSQALTQLRGITPDKLSNNRVPYLQGVEFFGMSYINNQYVIVSYGLLSSIADLASSALLTYGSPTFFIFMGDYRVQQDLQYQFSSALFPVTASINVIPTTLSLPSDSDGEFRSQTTGTPTSCWSLSASTPNIVRLYLYVSTTFSYTEALCNNQGPMPSTATYTLTREATGPSIMYELDPVISRSAFRDLRLSDILSINAVNLGINGTTDALLKSPGNNGYVTMPGGFTSGINIQSLTIGLWTTSTFVFRTNAAALGNTLLGMNPLPGGAPPSFCMYLMNDNQIYYFGQTPSGSIPPTPSGIILQQGTWYMAVINKTDVAWNISIVPLSVAQNPATDLTLVNPATTIQFVTSASQMAPNPFSPYLLKLGDGPVGIGSGIQPSSLFTWDIAWWHFFSTPPDRTALNRDALNNWLLTTPAQ